MKRTVVKHTAGKPVLNDISSLKKEMSLEKKTLEETSIHDFGLEALFSEEMDLKTSVVNKSAESEEEPVLNGNEMNTQEVLSVANPQENQYEDLIKSLDLFNQYFKGGRNDATDNLLASGNPAVGLDENVKEPVVQKSQKKKTIIKRAMEAYQQTDKRLLEAMEPYEGKNAKHMNDFHKVCIDDDPMVEKRIREILSTLNIKLEVQADLFKEKRTVHQFFSALGKHMSAKVSSEQVDAVLGLIGKPTVLYVKEYWKLGLSVLAFAGISFAGVYFGLPSLYTQIKDNMAIISSVLSVVGGTGWGIYSAWKNGRFTNLARNLNVALLLVQLASKGFPIALRIAQVVTGRLLLGAFAILSSGLALLKHAIQYHQANKHKKEGSVHHKSEEQPLATLHGIKISSLEEDRDAAKEECRQNVGWKKTKGVVIRNVLVGLLTVGVTALSTFGIVVGAPLHAITVTIMLGHMLLERKASKKAAAALEKGLKACDDKFEAAKQEQTKEIAKEDSLLIEEFDPKMEEDSLLARREALRNFNVKLLEEVEKNYDSDSDSNYSTDEESPLPKNKSSSNVDKFGIFPKKLDHKELDSREEKHIPSSLRLLRF